MVFKRDMLQVNPIIVVGGEQLETEFVYLGALLTSNNDCTPEIKRRINLVSQTVGIRGRPKVEIPLSGNSTFGRNRK